RQLQSARAGVNVVALRGDVGKLDNIPDFRQVRLDAAILSNVLHYFAKPEEVLIDVASRLLQGGRVVLIEYDRRAANEWVPYPIPRREVPALAAASGFTWHGVVSQR